MIASIRIQREDFDLTAEVAALTHATADAGAVASFTGHVRGDDDLAALTLEHYPAHDRSARSRAIAAEAGRAGR